jgi:hypothetical protein
MCRLLAFATLAGALSVAASAHAGAKYNDPVTVNLSSRYGSGTMADARNDGNPATLLDIEVITTASNQTAYVSFNDGKGNGAYCWTTNGNIIQTLTGANNDALVTAYWDSNSQCTEVVVANGSFWTPKTP